MKKIIIIIVIVVVVLGLGAFFFMKNASSSNTTSRPNTLGTGSTTSGSLPSTRPQTGSNSNTNVGGVSGTNVGIYSGNAFQTQNNVQITNPCVPTYEVGFRGSTSSSYIKTSVTALEGALTPDKQYVWARVGGTLSKVPFGKVVLSVVPIGQPIVKAFSHLQGWPTTPTPNLNVNKDTSIFFSPNVPVYSSGMFNNVAGPPITNYSQSAFAIEYLVPKLSESDALNFPGFLAKTSC